MPPKRGKKAAAAPAPPAPPPLDGCTIAFSGSFPGLSQSALQGQATQLGAATSSSITKNTTHLVTTPGDFAKPSTKVAGAQNNGIHIVSLQWLQDCQQNNARESEQTYAFGAAAVNGSSAAPAAPAAPQATTTNGSTSRVKSARANGSKKRQASPTPDPPAADDKDEDEAGPEKKKKKTLTEISESPTKRNFGEGQIAKSRDIRIPVDEHCPLQGYGVYIGDDGVIWDASLNQTNAGHNNNKFYRIQLLGDGKGVCKTWTRWGRVGDRGQSASLGNGTLDDAKRNFEKKFKDKSGLAWHDRTAAPKSGKYVFLERSYDESDSEDEDDDAKKTNGGVKDEEADDYKPPQCTLSAPVKELMELIFNQQYFAAAMSDLNYDANKLPLGKLSKATIMKGFQALKDLSAVLDDNSLAVNHGTSFPDAVENLSNLFYSFIPHNFGRNRPPVIRDQNMVKKEIELLDNLTDMKDATALMKANLSSRPTVHPLDTQYKGLGMEEMSPLDPSSQEFLLLKEYLTETKGHTHHANYNVDAIFRIERQGEYDRFEKSAFSGPPKDRRLLWHGSRATNFGGILSQGLRIAPPEAPVSGYMFGKGIYLADMSSKSANYCCSYISGGTALLLLCEAEMGDPMQELVNSEYNAGDHAKSKGMWTTWGKGRTGPLKWKDAGPVHPSLAGVKMPDTSVKPGDTNYPNAWLQYNEFICYDVSQIRLRYLFRVKM